MLWWCETTRFHSLSKSQCAYINKSDTTVEVRKIAPWLPGRNKPDVAQLILDFFAIILQNIRMWIDRKYEQTLKNIADQFPVTVVTGARQVGKTDLVKKVFPRYAYTSLDVPATAEQAERSPEAFLKTIRSRLSLTKFNTRRLFFDISKLW